MREQLIRDIQAIEAKYKGEVKSVVETSNEWPDMASFDEYINEAGGVPVPSVGPVMDRSLESFPTLLNQLMMAMKGVQDPQVKQALYQIVNPFNQQMRQVLSQYQSQGTGFSPRYEPRPAHQF